MEIEYTGRQTTVTQRLKDQADSGLAHIAKLVERSATAHVVLTTDKYRQIAEVTVKARDHGLVATCEATEMSVALHDALATIEQQAVRLRQKQTTIRRHPKEDVKAGSSAALDEGGETVDAGSV
jgi:putative sigma-54 modulation protein